MSETNIEKVLTEFNEGDELELRLGYYYNNHFKSSISYTRFNRILEFFRNEYNFIETYKECIVYMYSNGIRKITDTKNNSVFIKKTKKEFVDIRDRNVRLALNSERYIKEEDFFNKKFTPKSRKRYTFTNIENTVKIDMSIDIINNNTFQNQCEIEFITKPTLDTVNFYINKLNEII
jgi:hypothetical protein